jgi:hypothetical protein
LFPVTSDAGEELYDPEVEPLGADDDEHDSTDDGESPDRGSGPASLAARPASDEFHS